MKSKDNPESDEITYGMDPITEDNPNGNGTMEIREGVPGKWRAGEKGAYFDTTIRVNGTPEKPGYVLKDSLEPGEEVPNLDFHYLNLPELRRNR